MRAMVLPSIGSDFVRETRPRPGPGPGEVLVKVISVGAGMTLEHARLGKFGGATPRVMGHEFAGTVATSGAGVDGWPEGAPVTATFYLVCGQCERCAAGRETLCTNLGGFIGSTTDGAFADYIVVPARNLVAIPDGVETRVAGIVADAVATTYHAASARLQLRPGARIAVVGAGGGLGVHMLQMAKAFGAVAVAIETDERKASEIERRGLADGVIVPGAGGWSASACAAAGGPLDAVVDTVCSGATMAEGLLAIGPGGTLLALGFAPGTGVTVESVRLVTEEIAVTGTRYATRADIAKTLDLVRLGRIEVIVGASFALDDLNDAFEAIRGNEVFGRVVIDVAGSASD